MFGRKERKRLAVENAVLRQALTWYAAPDQWRRTESSPAGSRSPAVLDRGARARVVLERFPEPPPPSITTFKTYVTVPSPLASREPTTTQE